jgi:hypothetical protein
MLFKEIIAVHTEESYETYKYKMKISDVSIPVCYIIYFVVFR